MISYLGAMLRASGLHDRRMNGFHGLCLVVPVWLLLTAADAIVTDELFAAFYVLKEILLDIIPFASIWFLLHFMESGIVKSRAFRYFIIIMPALSIISLLTNPLHGRYLLSYDNPPATGPLFLVHLSMSLLCLFIVYIMLFRYISRNFMKQPVLLLTGLGAIMPIALYILYLFLPSVIAYDITPIGYFFTIIAFAYTAYRRRMLSSRPGIFGETLGRIAKSPEVTEGRIEDAARLIAKEGCTAIGAYRTRVWKYDAEGQTLTNVACYNSSAGEYTGQEDFSMHSVAGFGDYLASSRVLAISDIGEASASIGLTSVYDPEVCAVLMAPVCIDNTPAGLICTEQDRCTDFPERREWSKEEQSFSASLADLMAITINNAERQNLTRRLEEELSMQREFHATAFENAPIGLTVFNSAYEFTDCNDAALTMFNTEKEHYLSHHNEYFAEVQPDGTLSAEKAQSYMKRALDGEKLRVEWMHRSWSGELIPTEVSLTRIRQGDTFIGLAYIYDLRHLKKVESELHESTERERSLEIQKEAALIADKAKTELLANMSHEIRTPMHVIAGMSELLLSENLNPRQLQYAQDIKISADALLDIINDILDISKVQSAKLTLLPVHFNFRAFIRNVISIGKYLIRDKSYARHCDKLLCHYEIDEKIPEYLYGDDVRLRQIFINLLSNAIKYADEGTVSMTIKLDGTDMRVEVADTGRGIPEEDIPHLFNAFERIDEKNTRDRQGTGLGLAITKSLVELMGGKIWCESVYGEGSTFYFTIPIAEGDAAKALPDKEPDPVYAPGANVLIVDDRELNLKVIHDFLLQCGINASCATSGAEAIEKVKKTRYDLIFMDHMMPGLDGAETTAILRESSCETPIVALTANAVSGAKESLLAAGMDDFLSKPISKPELYRILRQWLPTEKTGTQPPAARPKAARDSGGDAPFWDAVEQIEEISVESGLETASGIWGDYKNTLRILAKEASESAEALRRFLEKKDLKSFCTEVHGIKGSLALAGAMRLSAKARELENASREGDIEFCRANLAETADALIRLSGGLKEAFEKSAQADRFTAQCLPPEFAECFKCLDKAMDSGDLDTIFAQINVLNRLEPEKYPGIEQLIEALQIMDYDTAREIIKK